MILQFVIWMLRYRIISVFVPKTFKVHVGLNSYILLHNAKLNIVLKLKYKMEVLANRFWPTELFRLPIFGQYLKVKFQVVFELSRLWPDGRQKKRNKFGIKAARWLSQNWIIVEDDIEVGQGFTYVLKKYNKRNQHVKRHTNGPAVGSIIHNCNT